MRDAAVPCVRRMPARTSATAGVRTGDAKPAARCATLIEDQFPLGDVARAGWLGALLSVVARHAIAGPLPLFVFDATTPGVGKTLFVQLIALIAMGRTAAVSTWPAKVEEQQKTLLSIALGGARMVLWDEAGELKSPVLCAALTSDVVDGRRLGEQTIVAAPFKAAMFTTANNVALYGDLWRRVVYVRLTTDVERPDQRTGFRVKDIAVDVLQHRGGFLRDALTILRAYVVAGRPKLGLTAWGGFEAWSSLVRGALRWLELADPEVAREDLRTSADQDLERVGMLHEAWDNYLRARSISDASIARVLDDLVDLTQHVELRHALQQYNARLESSRLGQAFKKIAGRVHAGRRLVSRKGRGGLAF